MLRHGGLVKLLFVILLLAAVAAVAIWHDELGLAALVGWVRGFGPWAPAALLLLQAAASLLFIPRLAVTAAAAVLFGPWQGFALGLLGATIGAGASFLLARHVFADRVAPRLRARLPAVFAAAESGGIRTVAALRLLPTVPHAAVNYAFGLTNIAFSSYLLGSLLGMVPSTVAGVSIGAAGRAAILGMHHLPGIAAAVLGLILLSHVISRYALRRRMDAAGPR
jgi:uncharacterized membrane protein YdjX (TVP38/TMEM64 family)